MRLPACGPVSPKLHQVPASVLGAGTFCFAPGGRWDCVWRAQRPAGSFSPTATPHGGWGAINFAALLGGSIFTRPPALLVEPPGLRPRPCRGSKPKMAPSSLALPYLQGTRSVKPEETVYGPEPPYGGAAAGGRGTAMGGGRDSIEYEKCQPPRHGGPCITHRPPAHTPPEQKNRKE